LGWWGEGYGKAEIRLLGFGGEGTKWGKDGGLLWKERKDGHYLI
jgi:hypothetical protein